MQDGANYNRTWAEVDLGCIRHNYRLASELTAGAEAMPVIKADAYGHGASNVAAALLKEGAGRFAVAAPDEALNLRKDGIDSPILLLGAAPKERVRELIRAGVALSAPSTETAMMYADAARGEPVRVHVKLDTGMSRLGLNTDDAVRDAALMANLPGFTVEGIFTHFAAADEPDEDDFTKKQFAVFKEITGRLEERGLSAIRHCANSAGILYYPDMREDLTRPGIMLYGYNPDAKRAKKFDLRPALAWRAQIVQLKEVKDGTSVGYGRAWKSSGARVIATVSAGYADGLRRNLSGTGWPMLVRGREAPLVGRVCMDMCMIDVTDIPQARTGDIATLIGTDGEAVSTADGMAERLGTISYEVLCAIGKRVPRYFRDTI